MKNKSFNTEWTQSLAICFCLVIAFSMVLPNTAFAASDSGDAIATVLETVVCALTGGIGKAVATIAIVVLGIGLFLGKLSWPLAVATAIGIGMIFGASEIVGWISKGTTAAKSGYTCPQ